MNARRDSGKLPDKSGTNMDSSSTLNSAVTNALTLSWAFGFNKDVVDGVHSLCAGGRKALFYVAAHTGVIYDYEKRTQELLQGHCNPICAVAVSHNKKWVVTADAGQDSMMVVWDTASGTPIKSIFNPHPNGVIGVDISLDSMFIVTLSASGQQESETEGSQTISLWEWTHPERDGALYTSVIEEPDVQKVVKFNPSDVRHIMTTGKRRTMFWSWENGCLRGYVPRMSRHDFNKGNGVYTSCCFLPGATQAITTTSIGEIVLWEEARTVNGASKADASALVDRDVATEKAQLLLHTPKRHAVKVLKLCDGAIVHVSTVSGGYWAESDYDASSVGGVESGADSRRTNGREATYIVVAGEDGAVRFYDLKFLVEAWFEDFDAGGVTSISFALELPKRRSGESASAFRVPDFVVGTEKAYIVACAASAFEKLDNEKRRGTVLVQGMIGSVNCVAAHPQLPRLAILCDSGDIHLWDYSLKVLVTLRSFDPSRLRPQSGAFHPEGTLLAIGFSSGACKILDASDFEEVAGFRYTSAALTSVRFSPDGEMVAACDIDNHVLLFKYSLKDMHPSSGERYMVPGAPEDKVPPRDSWTYIGRHRSHARRITGLEFGTREDGRVSLVSVAEDKYIVEYNLPDSNQENGLLIAEAPKLIEQSGLPSALMWHPLLGSDFEDRLVTANNEYKLKEWNADNKSCRKTSLGPTFGGPINRLVLINHIQADGQLQPSPFAAYGTADKVIGLVQMPFDGNSRNMMGLIAHPGEISSLSVSGDGSYLVTAGGKDLTVNMWKINTQALQNVATHVSAGNDSHTVPVEGTENPDDMPSFLEQLQGGEGGELHEEVVDFFFYTLLRTQGEDTTGERSSADDVPLSEVPNIMRALGYYPTEQEVAHMLDEVKYSRFTETGEVEESIDLNGLIRLFVNHRSVFPITKQMVSDAFISMGGDPHDERRLEWSTICAKLESMGERISDVELVHCLEALVGDSSTTRVNGRAILHPLQFAEEVLGFEDQHEP